MFNHKVLLTAITITLVSVGCAVGAGSITNTSADVIVCSGSLHPPTGCVPISVVSSSCVNLTDTLSLLDKQISAALIPGGFVCTFFEDFSCFASGTGNSDTDSEVVLTEGEWDLSDVPGLSGPEDFDDLTSSFACSPV